MSLPFASKLRSRCETSHSVVCVGLDPDPARIPKALTENSSIEDAIREFCCQIIEATAEKVVAFKLNLAFFEAIGRNGWSVVEDVLKQIPRDVITIADAKRGDIGNSARFYAKALLEDLSFDAVTISPYMGSDSVLPFLQHPEKAAFILARTSNPGGDDFQLLQTKGIPLYQRIAIASLDWDAASRGTVGLVAGASDLHSLAELRHICPETPFLIPGTGAQGASAEDVMRVAGSGPVLINSSRKIIFASSGKDFAEAAASATDVMRSEVAYR